ncbi:MAG TPA: GWxTD domain-containing protein [Candidatus Polarisedimenticolia bacterium]|nr:GWxTD domain-containing protein [Candidatus Polarisedimenticolia bacterium]
MRHLLLISSWLAAASIPSVLLAGTTPAATRAAWNRPTLDWRAGPVRYLLTDAEDKEYRSLQDAADRAAFVARFWASRDPDPFTTENEAEQAFWQRVTAAEELFTQTTISGWRTDRGRVYILLGPPDEITNYPVPSVEELDRSHFPDALKRGPQNDLRHGQRGAVEWVYRSLKNPKAEAGQLVTFVRDETGEYRMSSRLAPSFRYELGPGGFGGGGTPGAARRGGGGAAGSGPSIAAGAGASSGGSGGGGGGGGGSTEAAAAAYDGFFQSAEDLFSFGQAAMFQKAPPPSPEGGVRVTSEQFFGVVPIRSRLDFFEGAGGTSTLITLGIPAEEGRTEEGSPSAKIQIFGQLQKADDSSQVYRFSTVKTVSDPAVLQVIGGSEHRLYQVRGDLAPGDYRANFGARINDRIGAVGVQVQVPDLGGGELLLAGPILAETVGERELGAEEKAFVVGNLRLVPRMDSTYREGSDFGFYFQVYHPHPGTSDAKLHLDLQYEISVRHAGIFRLQGQPVRITDSPAPTHAYTFPLKGWAPGEYLITVTAADRVTGNVVARTATFKVQ